MGVRLFHCKEREGWESQLKKLSWSAVMVTGYLATRETRHQRTRHQGTISPPTYSPPSEVFSPPTTNFFLINKRNSNIKSSFLKQQHLAITTTKTQNLLPLKDASSSLVLSRTGQEEQRHSRFFSSRTAAQ